MALQGTFDTLELTAVLSLLARGRKTGTLHLDGDDMTAVVRLLEGCCCATAIDGRPDESDTPEARTAALVDVCFELARRPRGSFSFEEGVVTDDGCAVDVADAVGELDGRLARWEALRGTLPSLAVGVQLAAELPEDRVVLDRVGWRVLVSVDGATAEDVLARSGLRLLEGAEALAGLIDAGVATLDDEAAAADPPAVGVAPPSETGARRPAAAVSDEVAVPEPAEPEPAMPDGAEPEMAEADGAGSDPEGIGRAGEADDGPTSVRDRRDADDLLRALQSRVLERDDAGAGPAEAGAAEADGGAEADRAADGGGPPASPPERDDELRDRGALLRLFSSIRET